MPLPHEHCCLTRESWWLLCLPRTCIRGQGFVGCSWGILRFFDIQAISHQEALEVLSFLEARLQPCVCLVLFPLPSYILSYTLHVLYLVFVFHIRRLFYDLSLYPVSLYSIVVAQPFRSKSRSRVRQSITSTAKHRKNLGPVYSRTGIFFQFSSTLALSQVLDIPSKAGIYHGTNR